MTAHRRSNPWPSARPEPGDNEPSLVRIDIAEQLQQLDCDPGLRTERGRARNDSIVQKLLVRESLLSTWMITDCIVLPCPVRMVQLELFQRHPCGTTLLKRSPEWRAIWLGIVDRYEAAVCDSSGPPARPGGIMGADRRLDEQF